MPATRHLLALGLVALAIGSGASSPYASLTRFDKQVQVRLTGTANWAGGKSGLLLGQGDTVRTGSQGRAEVSYTDGTVARLGPKSLLVLDQHRRSLGRAGWGRFLGGQVWLKIAKGSRAEVSTPAAVASVVGTEFVLDVSETSHTKIIVLDGGVDFTGSLGDTVRVNGGFWGEAVPGKKVNPPQPVNDAAIQFAKGVGAPLPESPANP